MKYKIGDKVEFIDYWTAINTGEIVSLKKKFLWLPNSYLIRYTPYIHVESAVWIDENDIVKLINTTNK